MQLVKQCFVVSRDQADQTFNGWFADSDGQIRHGTNFVPAKTR